MQKNNHDCFLTSRVIFNFYNFLDSQIYFTIIIRSSFTSFAKTEINSWRKRNWLSVEEKKTGRLFYDGIIHGNSLLCSESSCSREISAPFYAPLYWDYDTYFYSSPNWKKVLFQRVKNHCFSESTFFQNFYLTYSGNKHFILVGIWSSNFPNVFEWNFDWLIFKKNISVKFLKNKFILLKK